MTSPVLTLGMGTLAGLLQDKPGEALASLAVLTGVTVATAFGLRALGRRSRSLRGQVVAAALAAIAVGALAAVALARLMVLNGGELRTVLGMLAFTAAFAVLLLWVATVPLARDVRTLEATVRRIEQGDRDVRTELHRSDELGHVAKALDELTARLDRLERERAGVEAERRALLSSISHDLRTPLAALRAALEALVDGVAPDPGRYLRSMQRDVEALTALVEDLFLLARLEAGRVDLHAEPVDLAELADEAVLSLAPVASASGVQVRLEAATPVLARGNAVALGRVIRNLLDNAVRHAPPGSAVVVTVGADGPPFVRVVDEGPGFPPGFEDRAFDQFTRADPSRSRTSGGAGLGLAIARGLVEAHGGRIWIEEPPGGRVAFELPAA
jgi:signal transduction histidine kinase